jgi:hypothetical protein
MRQIIEKQTKGINSHKFTKLTENDIHEIIKNQTKQYNENIEKNKIMNNYPVNILPQIYKTTLKNITNELKKYI